MITTNIHHVTAISMERVDFGSFISHKFVFMMEDGERVEIAKSGIEWQGKKRTAAQWKVLLVSGHAMATQEGAEIIPGLEGEFVNIRESTALMSIKRGASLIEYTLAFCAMHGVPVPAMEGQE